MEITFRSVDEASAVSGRPFVPGDRVWSCLYRNAQGLLERADVHEDERGQFELAGTVLCQWKHLVKAKDTSEADERRAALQSAEEVFLSLFEEQEGEGGDGLADAARDRLKFFLALQLERKRVLKPLGAGRYRHVPTKRELLVPNLEITPELVSEFQQEIGMLA